MSSRAAATPWWLSLWMGCAVEGGGQGPRAAVVRTLPCHSRGCCAAVGWSALGSTPWGVGDEPRLPSACRAAQARALCSQPAAPPRLLRRRRGYALDRQAAITAPQGGRGKGTAPVLWPAAGCARGQGAGRVPALAPDGLTRPRVAAGVAGGLQGTESEGATCGHRPHDHKSRESLPAPGRAPGSGAWLPCAGPTALDACAVPMPACLCPTWPSGPAHAADHRAACGRGKGPQARAPPGLPSTHKS